MPRKENTYKELRSTINDLVILEGKKKVEEKLNIVILKFPSGTARLLREP